MVGVMGIAVVGITPLLDGGAVYRTHASWWTVALSIPGHLLLLLAWWQLGPSLRRPMVAIAAWMVAMIPLPPFHSGDAFAYAAQGWLVAHGQNPYYVPAGQAGAAGELVTSHWADTTSVYPPLSLELFALISRLFDGNLVLTPLAMRPPHIVAVLFLAWVLPRLAASVGVQRSTILWAGLLNPVVLVQWVGGIHNDAVMVAVLAAALWAAIHPGWRGWPGMLLGGVGIGVACAVKQSAAFAGLGVVALAWAACQGQLPEQLRTWWACARRAFIAGCASILTFAAITAASGLGYGWNRRTAGLPLMVSSNSPLSWIPAFLRNVDSIEISDVVRVLNVITLILVGVAVIWCIRRWGPQPPDEVGRPWRLTVMVLMSYALLGPGLQPWYVTWVLPFFALIRPSPRGWRALVVVSVAVGLIPALQDVVAPYIAMPLLLGPCIVLWQRLNKHEITVVP